MWFVPMIMGGLLNIAGSLAGRVMLALGISVLTYSGVSWSIDFFKAGAVSALSGLPAQAVGMLALMKVDSCISMVVSAIAVKMSLSGLTSGSMTKWIK